jgi:multidrug resistance efflux pump
MNRIQEPDNEFLDRLEWQLSSEYRRTNRLKPTSGKIAISRKVVALAAMVGILMIGVAMTKAADYIKDSWRKKIEIARVQTEVELKKVQLESIRGMASDIKSRVSNGLIREDEYQAMQLEVENAELDFKRALLNLEEVKMSGDTPRNELYAPLVSGRDFVSERLEIEKKEAQLHMEQLSIQAERVQQLVQQMMVRGDEADHIQSDVANQKMQIDKIQQRLDLRARFLAGEITAQEVEIKDRMTGAERNLQLARSRVETLMKEFQRMQILEARGEVSHTEVAQLQYALDAARAELKLATLEMDVLEKLK